MITLRQLLGLGDPPRLFSEKPIDEVWLRRSQSPPPSPADTFRFSRDGAGTLMSRRHVPVERNPGVHGEPDLVEHHVVLDRVATLLHDAQPSELWHVSTDWRHEAACLPRAAEFDA